VTENITVDGVIDMAKGWFDPDGPPGVDTSDLQARNSTPFTHRPGTVKSR
jgi:hypothetical protein